MKELLEMAQTMVKILITGITIAAIIIGLTIAALSLKQCITVKQSQNVQNTEIH